MRASSRTTSSHRLRGSASFIELELDDEALLLVSLLPDLELELDDEAPLLLSLLPDLELELDEDLDGLELDEEEVDDKLETDHAGAAPVA
jgi:hypothetical protein